MSGSLDFLLFNAVVDDIEEHESELSSKEPEDSEESDDLKDE